MTAGQLAFAFVTTFPLAVLSRGVLGAGDAMIFTSVLRLVTVWFLVRQAPIVTQLTGQIGQLGAIAGGGAAVVRPARAGAGRRAFAAASSIGLVLMVAVALLVKDSPYRREGVVRIKLLALARSLRAVWGNPGHALGPVVALRLAVLGDRVLAAVGLPVPGRGAGPEPGRRPAPC